ncbi:hypothetical protein WICPIJ_006616 [Wickerhamomyces pijperi]|uniref:Uncharacterized protein n=1 Tax=Wickerhamomyces pijperi TaxID=599730 RepID=A0A9P8TKV4_WICPI|nr:hypothetical protein WICPIJ_006616 [Wickerhamomyces pijperi]
MEATRLLVSTFQALIFPSAQPPNTNSSPFQAKLKTLESCLCRKEECSMDPAPPEISRITTVPSSQPKANLSWDWLMAMDQIIAELESTSIKGNPVFKSHSVTKVDPPMENNLGDSESFVHQTKPSMLLSLPPYIVNSWIHFFGFQISISPLFLPTANLNSFGANFLTLDLCVKDKALIVCGL